MNACEFIRTLYMRCGEITVAVNIDLMSSSVYFCERISQEGPVMNCAS